MDIKIQSIEKLFKYILEYSYLLLPLIYFFSKSKRVFPIIALGLYGLIFFSLLHFYPEIPRNYRKFYQSLYTFLEYTFFAFIIWHYLKDTKLRKLILILSALFYCFQIIHYTAAIRQRLDSIPIGVETIILLLFIFIYFRQFFRTNISKNIYEYPSFWLAVGILLYLGCAFFFNILVNYIPQEQSDELWHFTYIPEIIKNILFAMVILGFPSPVIENPQSSKKTKDIPNLDII